MTRMPPTPPTTPPTIAPVLLFFPPELAGRLVPLPGGDVGLEPPLAVECDAGTALDAPLLTKSGLPLAASACAAVMLKLFAVVTSRKPHEGTEVPAGIGAGNLEGVCQSMAPLVRRNSPQTH